jgi:hypothetical protein
MGRAGVGEGESGDGGGVGWGGGAVTDISRFGVTQITDQCGPYEMSLEARHKETTYT